MEKEKAFKLFSLAIMKTFNLKIKEQEIKDFTKSELEALNNLLKDEFVLNFGIAGKAGSGKTTTLNALFGIKEKTSHVKPGTDRVFNYTVNLGEGKGTFTFYDFPGLQDSVKTDNLLEQDYKKYLPKCDVILWVIPAKDRALRPDEEFIKKLPKDIKEKIVIGISQVDLIYPENWNKVSKLPSPEQFKTIQEKRKDLSNRFDIHIDKIVEYCAYNEKIQYLDGTSKNDDRRFNLLHLVKLLLESCQEGDKFILKQSLSEKIFQYVFN